MSHTFAPFSGLDGVETALSKTTNVATAERIGSAIAGAALASYGFTRRAIPGAVLGLIGGLLVIATAAGAFHLRH